MKKVIWIFMIMLFSFSFSQTVLAQESKTPDEQKKETEKKMVGPWRNFNVNLGVNITDLDSSVRFGIAGVGLEIDVEEALGLDSSDTVFFGNGYYRFGSTRRHRFDFGYTSYRRDSSGVLGQDLPILGVIFPEGETVQTSFDFDMIRVGYSYSLLKDDRMDLGIGGSLYIMPIELGISSSSLGLKTEDITAPLPVLTLRGDFAITPKLFLKTNWDIFYLKIGDFEGSILSTTVALEYNFWKNVGFGLGFNDFRVQVEASGSDYPNINFTGNVNFEYRALNFYTKIFF